MKYLLLIIVSLLSSNVVSEVLSTPDFQLTYQEGWVLEQLDDPPSYKLKSNRLKTEITLSSLRFPEGKDLNKLANAWLDSRIHSEIEMMQAKGRTIAFEKNIKEIPIGYQIEYWGSDSQNRNFRFWSVVVGTKIVNIYTESYIKNATELEPIIRDLLKSLQL